MIDLRPDCLVFKDAEGEGAPKSVEHITLELIGESAPFLDETILKNAAHGVLHYFKEDLGQETVSGNEFAQALEKTLKGLGFEVTAGCAEANAPSIAEADLRGLAGEGNDGLELMFFPRLRSELHQQLQQAPQVLRFKGLRGCVKQLVGAKRWSGRCQGLHDQIVEYLRTCLVAEKAGKSCAMVVQ